MWPVCSFIRISSISLINKLKRYIMTQSQLEQIAMNAQVQPNNPLYNVLTRLTMYLADKTETPLSFKAEEDVITIVQCQGKVSAYKGERFVISTDAGSHICLKSFNDDVEITRIISEQKGEGSLLMDLVVSAYNMLGMSGVKQSGTLILECVGSVGLNENRRDMPVKDQAAFFRKFGFRKVGKYNPNHLHMAL